MLIESLNISISAVMPEILLTGLALVVLVLDFFLSKKFKFILGYLSAAGLLVILPIVLVSIDVNPTFGGTVIADRFAAFFNTIFIAAGILAILISMNYLKKENIQRGEYYYIQDTLPLGRITDTFGLIGGCISPEFVDQSQICSGIFFFGIVKMFK